MVSRQASDKKGIGSLSFDFRFLWRILRHSPSYAIVRFQKIWRASNFAQVGVEYDRYIYIYIYIYIYTQPYMYMSIRNPAPTRWDLIGRGMTVPPSVIARHVRVIALSLAEGKIRPTFQKCYCFNLTVLNCITWHCVSLGVCVCTWIRGCCWTQCGGRLKSALDVTVRPYSALFFSSSVWCHQAWKRRSPFRWRL